jgi:hypothetical protein
MSCVGMELIVRRGCCSSFVKGTWLCTARRQQRLGSSSKKSQGTESYLWWGCDDFRGPPREWDETREWW